MMRKMTLLGMFLVLTATAMPGWAGGTEPAPSPAKPVCSAAPVIPEGVLAPWTAASPMAAATSKALLGAALLPLGKAARLSLAQTSSVQYLLRPEKPGGSASYGGLLIFRIEAPGTYRVALSSGAWIDVIAKGKALTSVSHGHGPDCTGIRKMVDFSLNPGRYTLQIAANASPDMTLLVARLP